MNTAPYAARLGLRRGWMEFRHSLTNRQNVTWNVLISTVLIVVLVLQRDSRIAGMSLAMMTMPSLLGMLVAQTGFAGTSGLLAVHREDGTLLRAKTVPGGMVGYLVAQGVMLTLSSALNLVVLLVAGAILLDGVRDVSAAGWPALVSVFVLGMLATVPWGAVIGSLVRSPESSFGLTFLPVGGLVAISGIFYPITAMPGWVQGIAQVFPVYWLGLGMRAALLPGSAAAAEIGGSWRHVETVGVLGAWAVLGFLLAPAILRRMARRESGAALERRRERRLQAGSY